MDFLISHLPEIVGLIGVIAAMIRNHQKQKDEIQQLRKDLERVEATGEKEISRVETFFNGSLQRIEQKLDLLTSHLLNRGA